MEISKTAVLLNTRKCGMAGDLDQNDDYFIETRAILKIFVDINHQSIDIHHMKKLKLCLAHVVFWYLKTLLKLISQCSLVPYLKATCVKLEMR